MKQQVAGYGLAGVVLPLLTLGSRQILGEVGPEWQMAIDGLSGMIATFLAFRVIPLLSILWGAVEKWVKRKAGVAVLFLGVLAAPAAEASELGKAVLLSEKTQIGTATIAVNGGAMDIVPLFDEKAVLYVDFSASLSAFVIDLDSRAYQVGAIPGIGYGIKYAPSWWTLSDVFLSLDVFIQAGFVEEPELEPSGPDYFSWQVLPSLTIGNLVSIGVGGNFGISLHKELESKISPVLSLGLATAL